MNTKKSVVLIVTMLAAIITYAQPSEMDYKSKIESLNKEMVRHMIEGNIEKSLSMYTQDAISMPSNEPMSEGIVAIRAGLEKMAKTGMKVNSFEPTTRKVIPDGNLISEIGNYKINITISGMDQPVEDHGKYLTIWEKQPDGSLKIKVEIWNSDIQLTEQK